jgi:hypothetical protein
VGAFEVAIARSATGAQRGTRSEPVLPGDLNCDGAVDFADINPFVALLSGN